MVDVVTLAVLVAVTTTNTPHAHRRNVLQPEPLTATSTSDLKTLRSAPGADAVLSRRTTRAGGSLLKRVPDLRLFELFGVRAGAPVASHDKVPLSSSGQS